MSVQNTIPVVQGALLKNNSGQIKLNFGTALTVSGAWTASTDGGVKNAKTFDINAVLAGSTLSTPPTTTYPYNSPQNTSAIFDAGRGATPTGRLIENPIQGQVHEWRVEYSYSGKTPAGSADTLAFVLRNPVSGFRQRILIPVKAATGNGTLLFKTVGDPASIPTPNGYVIDAYSDTSWSACTVQILSILRTSQATENV